MKKSDYKKLPKTEENLFGYDAETFKEKMRKVNVQECDPESKYGPISKKPALQSAVEGSKELLKMCEEGTLDLYSIYRGDDTASQETEPKNQNNSERIETLAFKEQKRKPSRFSHCPYEMHLRKNSKHKPRIKL